MRAGPALKPGEVGRAAVAAHHHDRRVDAGGEDSLLHVARGAQRDRHDRRVDRGRHRAQLEPVQPGQVRRRARRAGRASAAIAATRVSFDASSGANASAVAMADTPWSRRSRSAAAVAATSRPSVTSRNTDRVARCLPRAELDLRQLGALARLGELGTTSHPDDADHAHVALEQRVHRLRRRVGDELDLIGADLRGDVGDALHDARCHALLGIVGGRQHRLGDDAGLEIDRNGLRERSPDVDADADCHQSAAPTPERRSARSGEVRRLAWRAAASRGTRRCRP